MLGAALFGEVHAGTSEHASLLLATVTALVREQSDAVPNWSHPMTARAVLMEHSGPEAELINAKRGNVMLGDRECGAGAQEPPPQHLIMPVV